MFEVTVDDTFAAGHYLRNYKGKCENPHGHNYKVRVTLAGAEPEKSAEIGEGQLSFHLAGSLPLDPAFKEALLGMKSEAERLQSVISFFENILPAMRRTTPASTRAFLRMFSAASTGTTPRSASVSVAAISTSSQRRNLPSSLQTRPISSRVYREIKLNSLRGTRYLDKARQMKQNWRGNSLCDNT